MRKAYLRLYKAAKKHHFDIQKQFDNKELSDEQYLILGFSDDIMSNVVNILLNYEVGSIESIGVDNSCRAIIEAISLLYMYKIGKINEKQVRLYRYQYSLVDNANLVSILKKVGLGDSIFDRKINQDKETALDIYSDIFGIDKTELKQMIKKREVFLNDPLSFLMKSPKDGIRMIDIINKYNPYDEMFVKIYTFFSIFEHPRYEHMPNVEKLNMKLRMAMIETLLSYVMLYFNANKYFIANDGELPTPHQDLFENEKAKYLDENIVAIRYIFYELSKQFGVFENGTDNMTLFFLNKMRDIAINMLISISLGYNEQTIAAFRVFMENAGTFNFINSASNQEEMKYLKTAFWCSSIMQVDSCIKDMKIDVDKTDIDMMLKPVYDNYYKTKYKLDSYEKFKDKMAHNSLFFFENSGKKSYNNLIRESLKMFSKEIERDDYFTAYKVAVDIAHASGYSFNATPIIIELYALRCVVLFWTYIFRYAFLNNLTLADHNIKVDIAKPMRLILEFSRYYNDEMMKIAKE